MPNNTRKLRTRTSPLRRALPIVVGVFLLAGIAAAATLLLRGCNTAAGKRSLPFSADREYCYTGDGFLYVDGGVLNFFSLEDESRNYSVELDSQSVSIAGTEQLKAVYSASSLQVVGTPFDNVIDGTFRKVDCGGKYIGAYVENADHSHTLRVYNSAGSQCYSKDFTNSSLLDFGFDADESASLWMSELITTGSAISTTITTYDLNRESITGVISVQGQVVKQIIMTKKSVFALCTDNLIRFSRETNDEAYRLQCRGYECVGSSASGGRMYLLLDRTEFSGDPLSLLVVKDDTVADETVMPIVNSPSAVGCFLMGGRTVLVNENEIVITNAKGETDKTVRFDSSVTGAEKLSETLLLVTRGSEALLYTIK
ncbi:MAG: hypothetical protein II409_07145 [Clostridia bacterium]|nr:hypothetical protein [Clostridia bacterium]